MTGIQYIIDNNGKRTAVVIDLKKHSEVWEDFEDQLVAEEKEKSKTTFSRGSNIKPEESRQVMSRYSLLYADEALQELKRIPKKQVVKIISKIETLCDNPLPAGVKKLKGKMQLWRIRVGDYRIIYSIQSKLLVIDIIRIRHRKDVYDNL